MSKDNAPATIKAVVAYWRKAGVEQFVYGIQQGDDGPVKIGRAVDPESRLDGLQCGNPYPLNLRVVIPGGSSVESRLHLNFHESQLVGEWFGLVTPVLFFLEGISDRARAFYEDRGVPPADYLNDWTPISALDRALYFDNYRGALTAGGYLKKTETLLSVSEATLREFRREMVA